VSDAGSSGIGYGEVILHRRNVIQELEAAGYWTKSERERLLFRRVIQSSVRYPKEDYPELHDWCEKEEKERKNRFLKKSKERTRSQSDSPSVKRKGEEIEGEERRKKQEKEKEGEEKEKKKEKEEKEKKQEEEKEEEKREMEGKKEGEIERLLKELGEGMKNLVMGQGRLDQGVGEAAAEIRNIKRNIEGIDRRMGDLEAKERRMEEGEEGRRQEHRPLGEPLSQGKEEKREEKKEEKREVRIGNAVGRLVDVTKERKKETRIKEDWKAKDENVILAQTLMASTYQQLSQRKARPGEYDRATLQLIVENEGRVSSAIAQTRMAMIEDVENYGWLGASAILFNGIDPNNEGAKREFIGASGIKKTENKTKFKPWTGPKKD